MYKSLSIIGLSLCLISSCKCGNDKQISDQTNQAIANDTANKTANVSGSDSVGTNSSVNDSSSSGSIAANAASTNKEENMYRTGTHRAGKNSKYPGEFPEGSERLLTERDVEFLSQWGLKVMMNEIYARHGMKFSDPMLTRHFSHQGWYHGTAGSVNGSLSKVEKENIEFLKNYKYKPGIQ